MAIFWYLAILTVIEIAVIYMPLAKFTIGVLLCALALGKATLVAMYFMHLKFETRTLGMVAVTPLVIATLLIFVLLPDESKVGSAFDVVQWTALLESTSALHMYRKRHGRISPQAVAGFLLLDAAFPRSVRFSVGQAEVSLHAITGRPLGTILDPVEEQFARLLAVEFDIAAVNAQDGGDTAEQAGLGGAELAAQRANPRAHGGEAVAARVVSLGWIEALPVIGDPQMEPAAVRELDGDQVRVAVAMGIRHRFADDAEQGLTGVRGHRHP